MRRDAIWYLALALLVLAIIAALAAVTFLRQQTGAHIPTYPGS